MKNIINVMLVFGIAICSSVNAQEFDLYLNEFGRPTDYRERISKSFGVTDRAIVYLGITAVGLMGELDDLADLGYSEDWTLARGSSAQGSLSCEDGGGLDSSITRSGFQELTGSVTAANCSYGGVSLNGTANFKYNDKHWDNPSAYNNDSKPKVVFPLEFTFNDYRIRSGDGKTYTYNGQVHCGRWINVPTVLLKLEGSEISGLEYRAPDERDGISWFYDVAPRDTNGNIVPSSHYASRNCDFSNVTLVSEGSTHRIDDIKFATEYPLYLSEMWMRSFRFVVGVGRTARTRVISSGEVIPANEGSNRYSSALASAKFVHSDLGQYRFGMGSFQYQIVADGVDGAGDRVLALVAGDPSQSQYATWSLDNNKVENTVSNLNSSSNKSYWTRRNVGTTDPIIFSHLDCRETASCPTIDVFYVDPITSKVSFNDYDFDGSVDEVDLDDDNDGQSDLDESSCGSNTLDKSSRSSDADKDRSPDCIDSDDDNDGVSDSNDAFPLDENESKDSDADGLGDNKETEVGLDPFDASDVTGSPREILWRNAKTGKNTLWSMESQALIERNSLTTVADLQWKVEGMANFSGDKKDEIFFRHQSRGDNRIWTIENGVRTRSISIPGAHKNWSLAAMGDFDGDGDADLIWRNVKSGQNRYWEMESGTRLSSLSLRGVGLSWEVAGTGDFDGDGNNDLLWRNTVSGKNAIWMMQGEEIKQRQGISSVSLEWSIAGVADFDGDGIQDLLWRNDNGSNSLWLVNGFEHESAPILSAGRDWAPFAVYDMNGDDMADIIWRNKNGANRLWMMNGKTRIDSAVVKGISDTSWVPVAVGNVSN